MELQHLAMSATNFSLGRVSVDPEIAQFLPDNRPSVPQHIDDYACVSDGQFIAAAKRSDTRAARGIATVVHRGEIRPAQHCVACESERRRPVRDTHERYGSLLIKFCPNCDRWQNANYEGGKCSVCETVFETTQDAISKLPEGNFFLMGC
jgi:hypothetical protein